MTREVPARLRKVSIKGFKTHANTVIEFSEDGGDLHCIEGEIDSGKTSLFAAIEMVATNAQWPEKYLHDDVEGVRVKAAEIVLEFDMPGGGTRRIVRTRTASSGSVQMFYEDGTQSEKYTKVSDKEVIKEVQDFTGFKPFDLDSKTTVLLQRSMANNPTNPLGAANISPETLMRRLATLSGSGMFETAKATIKTAKNRLAGQLVEAKNNVTVAQTEVLSTPVEEVENLTNLGLELQESIDKWHNMTLKIKAAENFASGMATVVRDLRRLKERNKLFDMDAVASARAVVAELVKVRSDIKLAQELIRYMKEYSTELAEAKGRRDALHTELQEAKKAMTLHLCKDCGSYCIRKVAA